jgi:hypothetical protein
LTLPTDNAEFFNTIRTIRHATALRFRMKSSRRSIPLCLSGARCFAHIPSQWHPNRKRGMVDDGTFESYVNGTKGTMREQDRSIDLDSHRIFSAAFVPNNRAKSKD